VKSKRRSIRSWILGGSVALHAAFAVAAVLIPKPERAETAAIELSDIKKKKEPPKPPPPPPPPPQDKPKPPPPPPRAQAQAKVATESVKTEALAPPVPMGADGFADLGGVALGNGSGGDGVAIAAAPGARGGAGGGAGPAAPKAVTKKAVQQLAPAGADACTQPVVPPKRLVPVQAKYTREGQLAEIEGLVRVQVTIDESGKVIAARVLSGLGYGLDESALEAAKKCTFEPATLCGRPVVGTAIVPERFELE
jgi:periplasmic protein TonB